MNIPNALYSKPPATSFPARRFPDSANPCPPLHSFPGVIGATSTIWEEIADLALVLAVPKGEIIYPKENVIPPIVYIKSGKIRVNFIDDEGNEKVPHYILAGGMVWEGFYAANLQFTPMPMKAIEKSLLYLFDSRINFQQLLNLNPLLVRNLLYSQAVKNLTYSKLVMINSHRKSLSRVALFLHEMWKLTGRDCFPGSITQNEMATLLSLHKVTVSNALATLKNAGILDTFSKLEVCFRKPRELMAIALAEAANQCD